MIILLWSLGVVLAQGTEEVQSHWKLNDDLERLAAVRPGPPPTSGGAAATPPPPRMGAALLTTPVFSLTLLPPSTDSCGGAGGMGMGGKILNRPF